MNDIFTVIKRLRQYHKNKKKKHEKARSNDPEWKKSAKETNEIYRVMSEYGNGDVPEFVKHMVTKGGEEHTRRLKALGLKRSRQDRRQAIETEKNNARILREKQFVAMLDSLELDSTVFLK